MIIVSQDKNSLVNFKNITQIFITECEEEENSYFIRYENLDGAYEDLGVYVSEKRAKEVLNEIINCYAHTEQYKCFSNNSLENRVILNELTKGSFIYGMPKE